MKKLLRSIVPFALVLALLLTGCAAKKKAADTSALTPLTTMDILDRTDTEVGPEFMTMPMELDAEMVEGFLGFSADVYTANVESAAISMAAIGSIAHLTAVVQCKDEKAAETVQSAIADQFNFHRWICVDPEAAKTITCGNYVFFAASDAATVDSYIAAFTKLAGEKNVGAAAAVSAENNGSKAMADGGMLG